jgi:putative hydroxymethylpyrimidine transport system ATP-binding protein
MLTVRQLSKRFDELKVLDGFSLQVPRNGFTVIIGPSGCGKSTLFDLLTGIVPPDGGQMAWCRQAVPNLGDLAAYMQQKDLLLPWLSLMDNSLLPATLAGENRPSTRDKAEALFDRLDLGAFKHYRPGQVSGGMRQRCALVRTLMFNRELVLLDEPLSALDAITRRSLQGLLALLQSEFQRTILMITHDLEEALRLADEVVVVGATPMAVRECYPLAGPKPRSLQDPELIRLKATVLAQLQTELTHAAV